jgi:hypothetical protein
VHSPDLVTPEIVLRDNSSHSRVTQRLWSRNERDMDGRNDGEAHVWLGVADLVFSSPLGLGSPLDLWLEDVDLFF